MATKVYSRDESYDASSLDIDEQLYARRAEIETLEDLTKRRGTPIPALYSLFYRFIQNPSAISVDTFKRMVDTDDTIGSGCDFLATCLAARLGKYTHPSKEISKWMNDRLDEIEGGWVNKVKEYLSATWAGFYVGEKVWSNTEHGFVIGDVVPLPPTTVLFEVDRSGRLTSDGVLQYQRNWNPYGLSQAAGFFGGIMTAGTGFNIGGSRPDPFAKFGDLPFPMRTGNVFDYLCVRIPKQKVIHYAFDAQGKFGNPYGRSLLRRAYKYYTLKDSALQQLSIALDRKAVPLTIVYASQHSTVASAKGNPRTNQRGNQAAGVRADAAALEAFKNVHTDSTIVLPGKKGSIYEAEALTQDFQVDAFMSALSFYNLSMLRALLIPALIFGSGDGSGSYSLGQEHSKTWDKILDGWLAGLKTVLIHQMIYEMLCYNFPRSAWEKDGLGTFGSRELSSDERDKELAAAETLVNIGAADMNDLTDLNAVREKAGFAPRDTPIKRVDPLTGEPLGEDGLPNEEEENEEENERDNESGKSGKPSGDKTKRLRQHVPRKAPRSGQPRRKKSTKLRKR